MTLRRIVVPEGSLAIGELDLRVEEANHVRSVLRLRPGAALILSDGAGREGTGELVEVSRRVVRVNIRRIAEQKASESIELTLFQCVGKGEKLDLVVRQATELGARVIVPVISERAVARRETRIDRLRSVAEDAIRISARAFRPRVEEVIALGLVLARPRAELALTFSLDAERSLGAFLEHASHLTWREEGRRFPKTAEVLIGPEGGLTPEELAKAKAAGFEIVHLGPHTLRTETAGPAVVSMVLFWARALGW